jgi:6-phosphogluconolactonase (cycloisomerase 2 family)
MVGRAGVPKQQASGENSKYFGYVGCFTTSARKGKGDGIAAYRINPTNGAWRSLQLVGGLVNPSWLLANGDGSVLYALHADEDYASSYAIDRTTGRLTPLNRAATGGRNGVSAKLDPTGKFLIVANYASGSVGVLPVGTDGSLEDAVQVFDLPGEARARHRVGHQGISHPHDIVLDPTGRFVVVPDKGLDRVFVFKFDPRRGRLSPAGRGYMDARSGAGPRHMAFHPTRPFAWVLNELDSTVTSCHWNAARGSLTPFEVTSTLPGDFTGDNQAGEIEFVAATGMLYASNRGHESLAMFRANRSTGVLRPMGWQPTGGQYPRFFGLDPAGRFLYAANMWSDAIKRFNMDAGTGRLRPSRQTIRTASPVTIAFVEGE